MVSLLHDEVVVENYSQGRCTMSLKGKAEFQQVAERSSALFQSRRQAMLSGVFAGAGAEIQIQYSAVLATDLPGGLSAGEHVQLEGRSVFQFRDGRITYLADYS